MAQGPLEEERVKGPEAVSVSEGLEGGDEEEEETGVAVKVAQLPEVNHVPFVIMHPFSSPSSTTVRKPRPENGVLGSGSAVLVGSGAPVVVVDGGSAPEPGRLGR